MEFSMLQSSATGNKDIGAFYGVNRTNKINDYQMSDMKNVDCESFPYLATRRARNLFYNENKMAAICHDTDIEDYYKVTGVTKGGGFVYRGAKVIGGGISSRNSVFEYLGDYVLLPEKKYVRVISSLGGYSASVGNFNSSLGEYRYVYGAESVKGTPSNAAESRSYGITKSLISCHYDVGARPLVDSFVSYFFDLKPGMFFSMDLFGRSGFSGEYDYVYCDIPEDVYMVIDKLYYRKGGVQYDYGHSSFNKSDATDLSSDDGVWFYIEYSAHRMENGEIYDVSQHFKEYASKNWVRTDAFSPGHAGWDYPGYIHYTNCFAIRAELPVMLGGVHYNGRFFAYDNMGVDIYYSSAADKYDFMSGTSLGDAGAVSCTDHGKWTGLIPYGGALYAFKKNGMYRIYSSDGLSFYMDKVADVGAVSREAVCVVSDVMYFLSETGLYRFTGAYPEELADNLGRRYVSGVLGGVDNKLYASLEHSDGCELVVYDASVGAYGVHDGFNAKNFVTYGGKLYGLDSVDGYVYEMSGERLSTEFEIITRKFFLGFEKKAINGLRIYFDFSGQEGEKIEVFVSYDNGEWEPCFKPITSGKLKYVPIKFKKCDELKVKISGTGVFTLKGMTLSLYSGGDIKQNK